MSDDPIKVYSKTAHPFDFRPYRDCGDVAPHLHRFWELVFFERGEGEQTINGVSYPFYRRCAAILAPSDLHSLTNRPGTTHDCIKVHLSSLLFYDSADFDPDRFPVLAVLSEKDYLKAHQLLDMLRDEFADGSGADSDLFSIHLIEQLLILIRRNLHDPGAPEDSGKTVKQKMLLYLQEHYCEPITAAGAAEALHYSPKYFSSLFSEVCGMTYQEYVKTLRLNHAHHLIRHTDLPVCEICRQVGFRSAGHFSEAFRQKFGQTPSALRNKLQK